MPSRTRGLYKTRPSTISRISITGEPKEFFGAFLRQDGYAFAKAVAHMTKEEKKALQDLHELNISALQ